MFNVGPSTDPEEAEERATGAEQFDLALAAIMRLERLLPNLLATASLEPAYR